VPDVDDAQSNDERLHIGSLTRMRTGMAASTSIQSVVVERLAVASSGIEESARARRGDIARKASSNRFRAASCAVVYFPLREVSLS